MIENYNELTLTIIEKYIPKILLKLSTDESNLKVKEVFQQTMV